MHKEGKAYNNALPKGEKALGQQLAAEIGKNLPEAESKIWHRHPAWFLDGNPVVANQSCQFVKIGAMCS